ncbi:MAG: PAC2 family protein [Candidatus Bathyarchaeia archaeon]
MRLVYGLKDAVFMLSDMEIRIIEHKIIPEDAELICGLPDVGLVGAIAVAHMIHKLDLREVAYVESDMLPPIIILENGLPRSPIRIFGDGNIVVVSSEIAIPLEVISPVIRGVVDWAWRRRVKRIFTLGGLPVPNRHEIEKLRIFGAVSDDSLLKIIEENDVEVIQRGFLVGPQALILKYCAERSMPAIALLAESFYNYPDPEASSIVIQTLNRIMGMNIDVSELIEKGEEVRLAMRDMMRRTQTELARMRKSHEYDIPGYYIR